MDLLFLTVVLFLLVAFAADSYHVARGKEEAEARSTKRWETMDLALTDERGVCWVCQQHSGVLELVDVGRRYELACLDCAHVLKKPSEAA